MHYSAAPCEPAKTSAGCRATHQDVFTLTVHTNTSNSAASRGLTSAPSMTINYPVVITPRDGQHMVAQAREEIDQDVEARTDQANTIGSGFIGLI